MRDKPIAAASYRSLPRNVDRLATTAPQCDRDGARNENSAIPLDAEPPNRWFIGNLSAIDHGVADSWAAAIARTRASISSAALVWAAAIAA
ncbi:MAG: hypothetical protein D6741_19060, partial [Planctomycetota bacterium]